MDAFEFSEGWMSLQIGLLLLAGYAAHLLGRRIHVPRVTLLIALGIIGGPYVLDIVPQSLANWFSYIAHFALAMVGFLLGEAFVGKDLKPMGRSLVVLPVSYSVVAAVFVFTAVLLFERSVVTALLLAGIAPASAPAATVDIIRENGAQGPLTKTLFRVVAIDDAICVILFTLLLAVAEATVGHRAVWAEIASGVWDIVGAVLLGIVLGFPMAWLTGRLKRGEPAILEAAGFVFVCAGLAALINVSYLLACIILGAVVANRAKHHTRPFHAIEGASDPFLAVFFLFAGFQLEIDALVHVGWLAGIYVVARTAGKVYGARWGATLSGAPEAVREHIGWCLLPQAGVALGLILLATEKIPETADQVLPMVIATTVIFEVVGPIYTARHLRAAGEIA